MLHIRPAVWWEDGQRCLQVLSVISCTLPELVTRRSHQQSSSCWQRNTVVLNLVGGCSHRSWVNFCNVSPDSWREVSCRRLVFHLGFWGYFILLLIGKQQILVTCSSVVLFSLQPLSYRYNRGNPLEAGSLGIKKKMIFSTLAQITKWMWCCTFPWWWCLKCL